MRCSKFLKQHAPSAACKADLLSQHKIISPSVPVDGVNSQDGVPAHVTVTVLQAGPDRRHERLEQLRLLQLAQETQSGAADELIGMLQVLILTETFHIRNTGLFLQR